MDTTWRSSSFASGTDRVEWRVDAGSVELRHGGHAEQGTLVLSRAEWQAFLAAAKSGQAGAIAY
ncbi:DUF397 domain-containing protein [Actinomycetospora chiangmaiensis]|uniref:DUF397 domain-containing protein n=1 Tax=Actinomycetospora chiangmaiensis TaxID=402650 RepID=UPI000381BFB4|nr:DUF397 domain-containing protein [Actinomycetospora chiangmaiensis]